MNNKDIILFILVFNIFINNKKKVLQTMNQMK